MELGGVEVPTRYLVAVGATVLAVVVLALSGGGQEKGTGTTTTTVTTVATTEPSDRSPITIRPLPPTSIVVRASWMAKGTSRYADRSNDRSSSATLTTLPASTTSLPDARPSAVGSGVTDGTG